MINDPIEVQKQNYRMTGISMGNPHAVIFSEEINGISLEETGRELEFIRDFRRGQISSFVM